MASLTLHLHHHHQPLLFISVLLLFPLLSSSSSSHSPPPHTHVPFPSPSPAALTDPPLSSSSSPSPFRELSPDIAPLLPSPGGVLPTPTGSDIPTIPSSPSPPNPDDLDASPGPFSALSPFGSVLPASNTPATTLAFSASAMAVLAGSVAYWFICRV